MFRRLRFLILAIVLGAYSLLYIATTKEVRCDDDCKALNDFAVALAKNRQYIYSAERCTRRAVSDSICVFVRDSAGINWSSLADTACQIATEKGLIHQKILFISPGNVPYDTLAITQCP